MDKKEDESGDGKDGEDDELPCVIGGESEKDCLTGLATSGYSSIVHVCK